MFKMEDWKTYGKEKINGYYGILLPQEPQYINTDTTATKECYSNMILHFQIMNAINKLPVALLDEYCDIMNIEIIITNGQVIYQNQAG